MEGGWAESDGSLGGPPQQLIACDNMRRYGIRFSRDWSLASVGGIRRVVWTGCLNHSTPLLMVV